MARQGTKKSTKAPPIALPPKASSAPPYPTPFTNPSSSLVTHFLSQLPTGLIYIIHIDRTPSTLKRRVFLAPVVLNLIITSLLFFRVYFALPTYWSWFVANSGHPTTAGIDVGAPVSSLFRLIVHRTALLFADYALFAIVGNWPREFFFGSAATRYGSPVKWRWAVPFQDEEAIIRSSRDWHKSLLPVWTADDELTLKLKTEPAISKSAFAKTGLQLLGKNWDLDYAAMVHAQTLIADSHLSFSDFDRLVVAFHQPTNSWMVWPVDREGMPRQKQAQKDNMAKFKDKLTEMGHEDLFYRWVELVQYESTMPGGFTEGRQASVMRAVRKMFEGRGLDFWKFWDEIGGERGMPGLDG